MDVPLTILCLMACVFMTNTKGSNSLQLTSPQATALPDQPYTLMCSGSGRSRTRVWYWRNDVIFRTRFVSDKQCPVDVANNYNYKNMSGRINVTCSYNQHSVTLMILTSIDNGSVWWCEETVGGQESNRLIIHVVNLMTMSTTTTTVTTTTTTAATTITTVTTSTTTTTATTTMPVMSTANATTTAAANTDISSNVVNLTTMPSTTKTAATTITTEATTTTTATTANAAKSDTSSSNSPQGGDNHVVYIAAGAGVCVAVIIAVVVSGLCIRRRRGRPVNNGSAHEHNHEASHTYYNENLVLQDQDINDKVQVENDIYETSRDVTSSNQPSTNDHMITDVYAQVQKPKKNTPKPTGTPDDINIEDLYAKPDKTKIRKKQED